VDALNGFAPDRGRAVGARKQFSLMMGAPEQLLLGVVSAGPGDLTRV
jgi:hypothetical protein